MAIYHLRMDPLADVRAYYDAGARLNAGLPLYLDVASTNVPGSYHYPQLLAIAVLPPLAGLSGDAYTDPVAVADAFRAAMTICAGVAAVGAVIGFITIRGPATPAR